MTDQLERPALDGTTAADGRLGRALRPTPPDLALAAVGALAAVLLVVDAPTALRVPVGVAAWFAVPGWAVVRHLPALDGVARGALTVVASLVLTTWTALALVWLRLWHPVPVAAALLLVATAAILLLPARPRVPASAERRTTRESLTPWLVGATALLLWAVGLAVTDATDLGDWGLLDRFPPVWYLAVALLVGLALWAVLQRTPRPLLAGAALAGVVVVLFASATIVEAAPRLPWVYKHIAVTMYIDATGGVTPALDLYNRWPGLFANSALFGHVVGLPDPVAYAPWAEVGFALLDAFLVVAVARALGLGVSRSYAAGLVFSVVTWVGQNYYAPQALAYTLFLALAFVLLAFLRGEPGRLTGRVERALARAARLGRPAPAVDLVDGRMHGAARGRWAAVVAVLALQATITVTHQLTPFIVVAAVLPLALAGYLRPRWLGVAVAVLPVLYLLPNLGFVESNWGIFSSFDVVENATIPLAAVAPDTLPEVLQLRAVFALNLLVAALAVLGVLRRVRDGGSTTALLAAWFAFAPALILAVQSYGGEARLRVLLFAFPWAAVAAVWLLWPRTRPSGRGVLGLSATLTALLALFTVVFFQPEAKVAVEPQALTASRWLDAQVRDGDLAVGAAGSFPTAVGTNYAVLTERAAADADVYFQENLQFYEQAESLEDYAAGLGVDGRLWVVFSDKQAADLIDQGRATPERLAALEASVQADPDFAEAYRNDELRIYRFTVPEAG